MGQPTNVRSAYIISGEVDEFERRPKIVVKTHSRELIFRCRSKDEHILWETVQIFKFLFFLNYLSLSFP